MDIKTSSALEIINYMNDSGWSFLLSNDSISDTDGGIRLPAGVIFIALFGKRNCWYRPWNAGAGEDFTEAVRNGAKKALKRGW